MDGIEALRGFNLLEEPWIPVVLSNGSAGVVSLMEAFERASNIRCITGDMPQQTLPIVRLMVAILYRSHFFAPESDDELIEMWREIWNQGEFSLDVINDYLSQYKSAFDLFDMDNPFFQVQGLQYIEKEPDPIGELMADVPKPEKYLFSVRNRNQLDGISYAEAARWLIFAQSYDAAGIKSPVKGNTHSKSGKVYAPKGAVGTGLLGGEGGVYLEGDSLFRTLMLNWVLFDPQRSKNSELFGNEGDRAPWEMSNASSDLRNACAGEPIGPVSLFTWQSRRMRLVRDERQGKVTNLISCYGDITTLVDKQNVETMTAWRESKQQQKKLGTPYVPLMPRIHDSTKLLWRGMSSLLVAGGAEDGTDLRPGVIRWIDLLIRRGVINDGCSIVSLHAQGMEYGTQSSVIVNGIDDEFSFPVSMLRYESPECLKAIEVVNQTDEAVTELARFVSRASRASGSLADPKEIRVMQDAVREKAYGELDALFKRKLVAFTQDEDAISYCNAWRSQVRAKLASMAKDYVSSSCGSLFAMHDNMSVGRAYFELMGKLSKILGKPSVGDDAEGRSPSGDDKPSKGE